MNIFATLPSGDSATWLDDSVTLPDGRTADATAWVMTYYLRGPSSLDLVATASGKSWSTTLTSVASAALAAGTYAWTAIITSGLERITIGSGQCVLTPDMTQQGGAFDPRSLAQRSLDACEAAMSTFNATGGKVKKYEIAGRTMEFQTITELMTLHSFWKAKVMSEQSAQSVANGLGNPRNLLTRFRGVQ
jgi:hypothetical protein